MNKPTRTILAIVALAAASARMLDTRGVSSGSTAERL